LEISCPDALTLIMETTLSGNLLLFPQISSLNHKTIVLRC
jgi:hypothetical protein